MSEPAETNDEREEEDDDLLVQDYVQELEDLFEEWPDSHHDRGVTFEAQLQALAAEAQRRDIGKEELLRLVGVKYDARREMDALERRMSPGGEA